MATGDIPKARTLVQRVRDRIAEGAALNQTDVDALDDALGLMTRERHKQSRAKATARRITPELIRSVKLYVAATPSASYRDVGKRFDIDGGRVSEIMSGEKDHLLVAEQVRNKRGGS